MRPPSPAQARGFPTLLFEAKPPGDLETRLQTRAESQNTDGSADKMAAQD